MCSNINLILLAIIFIIKASHMEIISSHIGAAQLELKNSNTNVVIDQPEGLINFIGTFIMFFLYFIYFFKIMMLSFFRRKKFNLKQRTYRKFIFAHQEALRYFTDEDKSIMQVTLNNTMKNASPNVPVRSSRLRRAAKSVSIQTRKNQYYQPKTWKDYQQQQELSSCDQMEQQEKDDESFQQKKIQDEHIERSDLLQIDQKADQSIEEQQRKNTIVNNNEAQQLLIDDIS